MNDKIVCMTKSQEMRWRAELEIIKEIGKVPSSREMTKLLKEKKGITVNHNTVNNDLKKDLESLTKEEYENQKFGILSMIDDEIDIAHGIATTNEDDSTKLKAMNTVSKLSKTKADVLTKFRKAQAAVSKDEQPIYNVSIGQPKVAKKEELDEDIEETKRNDAGNE